MRKGAGGGGKGADLHAVCSDNEIATEIAPVAGLDNRHNLLAQDAIKITHHLLPSVLMLLRVCTQSTLLAVDFLKESEALGVVLGHMISKRPQECLDGCHKRLARVRIGAGSLLNLAREHRHRI